MSVANLPRVNDQADDEAVRRCKLGPGRVKEAGAAKRDARERPRAGAPIECSQDQLAQALERGGVGGWPAGRA